MLPGQNLKPIQSILKENAESAEESSFGKVSAFSAYSFKAVWDPVASELLYALWVERNFPARVMGYRYRGRADR